LPTTNDLIVFTTIAAGVGSAAIVDLGTRRVPNALTISLAAAGIALAATGFGRVGMAASFTGCVLGAALMLPGHVLGGTGAGDVKLLAAAGTLMGPSLTLRAFVITAMAGGVMAGWVAMRRGRLLKTCGATATLVATAGANATDIEHPRSNNRFAYAPAIAVGVMLAALGW
jgi:Flp pilus assembly protein protease CpaA